MRLGVGYWWDMGLCVQRLFETPQPTLTYLGDVVNTHARRTRTRWTAHTHAHCKTARACAQRERRGGEMAAQRQCKVLNVAEKNDAARELSKVMSRGRFNRVR